MGLYAKVLVLLEYSISFGERLKCTMQQRLDCDKLSEPTCPSFFRNVLVISLKSTPHDKINRCSSLTNNTFHSATLVAVLSVLSWHSGILLSHCALQSISADGVQFEARLWEGREINTSLRRYRETWYIKSETVCRYGKFPQVVISSEYPVQRHQVHLYSWWFTRLLSLSSAS